MLRIKSIATICLVSINVVSFPKLFYYLKFQFLLATDITDENGSTGLQIASANGHVSNEAVSKIMTIVTRKIQRYHTNIIELKYNVWYPMGDIY